MNYGTWMVRVLASVGIADAVEGVVRQEKMTEDAAQFANELRPLLP